MDRNAYRDDNGADQPRTHAEPPRLYPDPPRVHADQRATVVLDSYPDWRIAAHVITIVPTANQQKATIKVRIGFDKPDARILPQVGALLYAIKSGKASMMALEEAAF